ncbi:MAG: two-component regulator propeller domain-containing protein, partial [Saprospiraceae bacterium]
MIWNRVFWKEIVLILILGLGCRFVNAQDKLQMELLSTEDGLSQGMINDILQDREGFIWIATKDGLNRYDGYHFKVFTNDPNDPWSISGNTVELLFEDTKGRIWAASDNAGLNIYDKNTGHFHHINYNPKTPGGLTGNNISAIVEDSSGFFIVGIDNKELNMFRLDEELSNAHLDPQVVRIPMPPQKINQTTAHPLLKGIGIDTKNRVWVGVQDAIYQLDVQKATLNLSIEGYSIGSVFANPDGSIWTCGGPQSLLHWDGEKATKYLNDFKDAGDILVDQNQQLWLLRIDSLLGLDISKWKPDDLVDQPSEDYFFRWQPKTSLGDFLFTNMTVDRSGILWVGSSGLGLYKVNPKYLKFAHFLPGVSVRQISPTHSNQIFIKSYLLEWYDETGTFLHHDPLQNGNSPKRHIDYLLTSQSGDYWIRQPDHDGANKKKKKYSAVTEEV